MRRSSTSAAGPSADRWERTSASSSNITVRWWQHRASQATGAASRSRRRPLGLDPSVRKTNSWKVSSYVKSWSYASSMSILPILMNANPGSRNCSSEPTRGLRQSAAHGSPSLVRGTTKSSPMERTGADAGSPRSGQPHTEQVSVGIFVESAAPPSTSGMPAASKASVRTPMSAIMSSSDA